jgi:hypothetical protein
VGGALWPPIPRADRAQGPTHEFYTLVSQQLQRRDLRLWRDADPLMPGEYVANAGGLFPAAQPESAYALLGGGTLSWLLTRSATGAVAGGCRCCFGLWGASWLRHFVTLD